MRRCRHAAIVIAPLTLLLATGALAGPLTPPPGPITSTLKTLTEVEPRTAVNPTNTAGNVLYSYIISQSGSYYLDRNIIGEVGKYGILINADNVTLDLNGFEVRGVPDSRTGIILGGNRPVIKNGQIRNWPEPAISFSGSSGIGGSYFDLTVTNNGAPLGFNGLDLRDESRVMNCVISGNAGVGIRVATGSLVSGCLLEVNARGGVEAFDASRIQNNNFSNNNGPSISVGNTGGGGCFVLGNTIKTAIGATTSGIVLIGNEHIIKANTVVGTGGTSKGIRAVAPNNVEVSGNTVSGTIDNYDFQSGANNKYDLTISEVPESIDWPANVRLAGSLTVPATRVGILISTPGVTLDLGGFVLDGGLTSAELIRANGSNTTIRNGSLRRSGADGIVAADGLRIENVSITQSASGGNRRGLVAGRGSTVSNVNVRDVSGVGITTSFSSIISNCIVEFAGGGGFVTGGHCTLTNCTTAGVGDVVPGSSSFELGSGSIATGCNARSNIGNGFNTGQDSTLRACSATANLLGGFVLGNNARLVDCISSGNGNAGVRALNVDGWAVERCTITLNGLAGVNVEGNSSQGRIDGNIIRSSSQSSTAYGVVIGSGSQAITVTNNQINQTYLGVMCDGSSCRITGNAFGMLGFYPFANSALGNVNGTNLVGPIVTPNNVGDGTNGLANTWQ